MPDEIMTPSADASNPDNPGTPDTPLADSSAAQPTQAAAPATPTPSPASTPMPTPQTAPAQTSPTQSQTTVSNPDPNQAHPLVKSAGVIRSVAQQLAGGPQYQTKIDPATGQTLRTQIPLSKSQIAMGIVASIIGGAATGFGTTGPNAAGRAAASAFTQGQQRIQAQQQAQEAQAQQDLQNQRQAHLDRLSAFELNSRAISNTSQAERYGVESLKDAVQQNAELLQSYDDAGQVQDSNVPQDVLLAGVKSGSYDSTSHIAIPDGWTNINGKYEQTFSVINSPSAKVPLSSDQVKQFASAGIPGFVAYRDGHLPADGAMVPGTVVARANSQLQGINLMKADIGGVVDTLSKSPDKTNQALAKSIPSIQSLLDDPQKGAGLFGALQRFQKYVSHSDQHGMDLYESLLQMSQPSKQNPLNPKAMTANTDAPFATSIAGAIGNGDPQRGWAILKAYHNEVTPAPVTNETQATAVLADPDSTAKAKIQARNFLRINTQNQANTAGAEAGARAAAERAANGSQDDVATLGESLAKGALTEDMIPGFAKIKPQIQAYLAQHHPNLDQSSLQLTGEERKRRDLATNALTNLGTIQSTLQRRPDLLGVIQGRVSQGKELTGTNDGDLTSVNEALDNFALASTGAHGIRAVQARADAKQALLNGFKNGPAGVNAAINTARQSLSEFANAGKPRGLNGSAYVYGTQPTGAQPNLTNIQVNPQTKQRIGWNGSAWVDASTFQKVQ